MKTKSDYRQYFNNIRVWVKMNYFLKQCNIDSSNFSRFLKGEPYDYLISIDRLECLSNLINQKLT